MSKASLLAELPNIVDEAYKDIHAEDDSDEEQEEGGECKVAGQKDQSKACAVSRHGEGTAQSSKAFAVTPNLGPEWRKLLRWGSRALGLDWRAYDAMHTTILDRLRRRMSDLECSNLEEYRRILQDSGEAELSELHRCVLQVDISSFFRNCGLWQFLLSTVLPELWRNSLANGQPCRCWIMGAGLGEEVYSLRACWEFGLAQLAAGSTPPPRLEIVVSEIAEDGVSFARTGIYDAHGPIRNCKQRKWEGWNAWEAKTFRDVPEQWLTHMFSCQGDDAVRVVKQLRQGITWRCESWDAALECEGWLETVGGPFDLILGRHGPFFYPERASQLRLVKFCASNALVDGGFLVVGKAESKRFAKKVEEAAPNLTHVSRPLCICRAGRMPKAWFKRSKKARTAVRPHGQCTKCVSQIGNPGKMVWRKG